MQYFVQRICSILCKDDEGGTIGGCKYAVFCEKCILV